MTVANNDSIDNGWFVRDYHEALWLVGDYRKRICGGGRYLGINHKWNQQKCGFNDYAVNSTVGNQDILRSCGIMATDGLSGRVTMPED